MSEDWRQTIATRMTEAGGNLRVKSALNPVLWLCGITAGPAMLVAAFAPNPPWWIPILTLGPPLLAGFAFVYFMFKDPDKLQSEEFQLKKRTLEMFEQKGMPGPEFVQESLSIISPDETPKISKENLP